MRGIHSLILLLTYVALLLVVLHFDISNFMPSGDDTPPWTSALATTVHYGSGTVQPALVHDAQGRVYESLPQWQNLRRYRP